MSNAPAPEQVRSFFDRWTRLEAEKAAIAEDLKELFAEAKGAGFDTKALRAAFRARAAEQSRTPSDDEFDALVEMYADALDTASRAHPRVPREGEAFYDGEQWSPEKMQTLAARGAPALPLKREIAPVDARVRRHAETLPRVDGLDPAAGRGRDESPATLPHEIARDCQGYLFAPSTLALEPAAGRGRDKARQPLSRESAPDFPSPGQFGANKGGRHVTEPASSVVNGAAEREPQKMRDDRSARPVLSRSGASEALTGVSSTQLPAAPHGVAGSFGSAR